MSATASDGKHGAVSLADEEAVRKVLVDCVLGLWDTVNNLTRLKPSRRDHFRVTIFGSARASQEALPMRKRNARQRRWPRSAATSSPAVARG